MSDEEASASRNGPGSRRGRRRPPTIEGAVTSETLPKQENPAQQNVEPPGSAVEEAREAAALVGPIVETPTLDTLGNPHAASGGSDELDASALEQPPAADAVLEGGVSDAMLAQPSPMQPSVAVDRPSRASSALAACLAGLIGGGLVVALEWALRADSRSIAAAQTRRLSDLENQFSSLEQRVKAASAEPAAPAIDPVLPQRIAALEQKVANLAVTADAGSQTSAQSAPAATVTPPLDLGPVQSRLDDLDRRSGDLAQQVQQATVAAGQAREAVAQAEAKVRADAKSATDALISRLGSAEQKLDAVSAQQAVLRGAPALAVLSALRAALEAGRPIGTELAALEGLGVAPEKLAALRAVSAGSPDGRVLADQLAAVKDRLAAPALPENAGVASRLLAHATSLVKITPVGDASGDGAIAIASRAEAALRRDALPAAKAELDRLPAEARPVVAGITDVLAKRLAARDAAASLETDAFGAIASARPRS